MARFKLKDDPALKDYILTRIRNGVKYEALAVEVGVSNTTISRLARINGIFRYPDRRPGRQDEIMALVHTGLSYNKIAMQLGLGRTYVRMTATRNGVHRGTGTGFKLSASHDQAQ
jgi:hypothetical protein